jgi:uncharacterized Zn finger protein (UPF0148 family)
MLRYEKRLDPAGGEEHSSALYVGRMVHEGLAAVFKAMQQFQVLGLDPSIGALHAAAQKEIQGLVDASREEDIFDGDEDYWESIEGDTKTAMDCLDLFIANIALSTHERYDVIAVEFPFRVPLRTPKGRRWGDELEGVMDLVLRDRQLGTLVVGEHKTTSGGADDYELMLNTDTQLPLYTAALREMVGRELVPGAVLLNVVRKKAPSQPKFNQDGTVSVAACDTTRAAYQAALDMEPAEPEWLAKARAALKTEQERPLNERSEKKIATAEAALSKQLDRVYKLRQKQDDRLNSLPPIEKFVCQHFEQVSEASVTRSLQDAHTAARAIRLFRRGEMQPWRNGQACDAYGRKCAYYDACIEDIVEPGDLLVQREHRHREVAEARANGEQDLLRLLERT